MPNGSHPALGPYLLLENPWPLAALLVVVGIMLGYYGLRYQIKGLWIGSAAGIALAVGVVLLAGSVESNREQVMRLTKELVDVTLPPLDEADLSQLLAGQVTLEVAGQQVRSDKQQVLEQARRVAATMEFPAWSIQATDARTTSPDTAQSTLRLSTTLRKRDDPVMAMMGQGTFVTTWLFDWRRAGEAWRVTRIEWLKLGNQSPAAGMLP